MPNEIRPEKICPFLGLDIDRDSHFSYPEESHRCFSAGKANPISLEHQTAFCLGANYPNCQRYTETPVKKEETSENKPAQTLPRVAQLSLIGVGLGLVALVILFWGYNFLNRTPAPPTQTATVQAATATPSHTPTIPPTEPIGLSTPTLAAMALPATPTPLPTPVSGGKVYVIVPEAADAGWVVSNEDSGNHLNDSFLYAGIFDGHIYLGAILFDLSVLPRGASIEAAALQLTGLRDDLLNINAQQDVGPAIGQDVWAVRMLDNLPRESWRPGTYQNLFNSTVLQTLNPLLSAQDLGVGKTNTFELSPSQLTLLENRILESDTPIVAFRLDGPLTGPNNLFAWDSGYGSQSLDNQVLLTLNVGPAPATPPPYNYVIITSTPTPENVMTAAAIVQTITAEASSTGTATPLPPNVATATPIPDYLIIHPTDTPANAATAWAVEAQATAQALTTGTATPLSTYAITVTPTPTPTPPPPFVLITATPTPETVFAAATLSVQQTAMARKYGPPTPLPANWVTPVVVTLTPAPANAATAQAQSQLAAAIALTTGTPTPTPPNTVLATSTPVFIAQPYILLPSPTPAVLESQPIPQALLGKVLFQSDREGEETYVYVFDPATGELGRLTDSWPYTIAHERDSYSADLAFSAYVKQLLWTSEVNDEGDVIPTTQFAIHYYDHIYNQEKIVTQMGAGIVYDPAWSPTSNQIAFVATESGNDEIWVINYDGSQSRQLTLNTWEWDKSPSWSPDGKQIVFSSNRTGNDQLWVMNADGSDQHLLMGWDNWTPYNDRAPVWVKYLIPLKK